MPVCDGRIMDVKTATPCQHVVVAAILNERNEVLLALRPRHKHQGGLMRSDYRAVISPRGV
jgi:hypothetical protein